MLLPAKSKGTEPEVMKIIKELRNNINGQMEWQQLMGEQRSRMAWLKEGDKNMKLYEILSLKATQRRCRNEIAKGSCLSRMIRLKKWH